MIGRCQRDLCARPLCIFPRIAFTLYHLSQLTCNPFFILHPPRLLPESDFVQMPRRLHIMMLAPESIIQASNDQHAAEHNAGPIHIGHPRRAYDWEEACNAGDSDVEHCEGVDGDGGLAKREARGWKRLVA